MGNTTSHKRHGSGDDTGPCLTAGRHSSILDDGEMFDTSSYVKGNYRELVYRMMKEAGDELNHELEILAEDFHKGEAEISEASSDATGRVAGEGWDDKLTLPQVKNPKEQRPRASTLTAGKSDAPASKLLPTVFKWKQSGKEVYLSGTFNNWKSKIPMVKSNGDFFTIVDLPPGVHNYKFLVDGQWVHDPNELTTGNNLGGVNNVIHVKNTDFEVFEALDIDLLNSSVRKKSRVGDTQLTVPTDYGQTVPERRPNEKHPGPPILPPHLLQVILNKDTPAHCEPTLLPEPNHVMLNHLYALSIKDGVMVLSATHRFRKKYVTTLLYKPI